MNFNSAIAKSQVVKTHLNKTCWSFLTIFIIVLFTSPVQISIYNKLVRDKIPEIIANDNGKTCVTRIMDDDEYLENLNTKMQEELKEYLESGKVEELADLFRCKKVYFIMNLKQ